jgi:probable rRNA maturation factor
MIEVEFNNLTQVKVNQESLKKIIGLVLGGEGVKQASISVALVGPGRMRKLNRLYRNKNRVTDVLSFPNREVPLDNFKTAELKESEDLGEIIVCLREVKKTAKRMGSSFEKELARVLIHGTLHLLGYDHEKSEEEEKKMKKKEEEYLGAVIS